MRGGKRVRARRAGTCVLALVLASSLGAPPAYCAEEAGLDAAEMGGRRAVLAIVQDAGLQSFAAVGLRSGADAGTDAGEAEGSDAGAADGADESADAGATGGRTLRAQENLANGGAAVEVVGSSFSTGGMTFTVTVAAAGAAGEVRLDGLDADAVTAEVPSAVVSPSTGSSYAVTGIWFQAFANHARLASVRVPATVSSYRFNVNRASNFSSACFVGCPALEAVQVEAGCPCLTSVDGVLYAAGSTGEPVALMAFPQAKSGKRIDVPKTVHTVAAYAFAGNATLREVYFAAGLEGDAASWSAGGSMQASYQGGIGYAAFSGCTALSCVAFPEGARLATASTALDSAIGSYAFRGCTALAEVEVPAIATAERKADAYSGFDELNPQSALVSGRDSVFETGYAPYWHNALGPVARSGIGTGAFEGCTALSRVTFAAGAANGAFAYWTRSSAVFSGCTNLSQVVYGGAQAWWGDPEGSMQNGTYTDMWAGVGGAEAPKLYYTVSYFATREEAQGASAQTGDEGQDAGQPERSYIAQAVFERATPVAAIASNSARPLEVRRAGDVASLGQTVPDPAEAARAAGLGEGDWAWALYGAAGKRVGLVGSCNAYLVQTNDLSAGRLDAVQVEALYRQAVRNMSRGIVGATSFDPVRYYAVDKVYSLEALADEQDVWFTFDPATGALDGEILVRAADGTALVVDDYTLSYQVWDANAGALVDAELGSLAGPYLVTVTPNADSGYTGTLKDWVMVRGHEGTVGEQYGADAAAGVRMAKRAGESGLSFDYSGAPYAATVSAGDTAGALVASGYAGLVRGALNVGPDGSAAFGFTLDRETYADGSVRNAASSVSFSRAAADGPVLSPSSYAVSCYKAFERRRASVGAPSSAYPWGQAALLVPVAHMEDAVTAAAYAYAANAPVLFTEQDGSVSADTAAVLSKFGSVAVAGGAEWFSDDALAALAGKLPAGVQVKRLGDAGTDGAAAGSSGGSVTESAALSLAVARSLVESGLASWANVSVVGGTTSADFVAALNYSGHEGGVTLAAATTSDAVACAELLHAHAFDVNRVVLFGRTSGNAAALSSTEWNGNAFGAIWADDATFAKVMAAVVDAVGQSAPPADGSTSGAGAEGFSGSGAGADARETAAGAGANDSGAAGSDASSGEGSGSSAAGPSASSGFSKPSGASVSKGAGASSTGNSGQSGEAGAPETPPAFVPHRYGVANLGYEVDPRGTTVAYQGDPTAAGSAGSGANSDSSESGADAATDVVGAVGSASGVAGAVGSAVRDALGAQAGDDSSGAAETAPLSQQIPFVAALAALCSTSIPILRRMR